MKILKDIDSEMRMLGMLPFLLALSVWYLARGDRLWYALHLPPAARSRSFTHSGFTIVQLARERARRRRS